MPGWSFIKMLGVIFTVLLVLSLASIAMPNVFFEYCTTKAHGFPFPWRMDYCECEQTNRTVEPLWVICNFAILGLLSIGLAIIGGRFVNPK